MDEIHHQNVYTNMNTAKEYNIEIIQKDTMTLHTMEYIRNYPQVYQKHITINCEPIVAQKHTNVYLNDGCLRELNIVPESHIKVSQIVCQEHNYENMNNKDHQLSNEFVNNRTEEETKQLIFYNKQMNMECPPMLVSHDSNRLTNFKSDYSLIEPQYVTLDKQQILQQNNLYPNFQSVSNVHQNSDETDAAFVCQNKQNISLDFEEQNETNELQYQQKQSGNITSYSNRSDISKSYNSNLNNDCYDSNSNYDSNVYKNEMTVNYAPIVRNNFESNDYKCSRCDSIFSEMASLELHVKEMHQCDLSENVDKSKNVKMYSCCNCLYSTKYPSALKRHKVFVHKCDNNKKSDKIFSCKLCHFVTKHSNTLKRHTKEFHRSDIVKVIEKCKDVKNVSCKDCSFVTKYPSALKRHQEVHTANKSQLECPTCGKIFNQLINWKTHQRIHTGEKVYQCDECEFITPYHYSLKRHKIYHSGEKPFSCFVCNKKFSALPDLTRHLRSHTGQKPYLCNLCGCMFRQTGHLKFHRSKHHPEYEENKTKSKPTIKVRINLSNPLSKNEDKNNRSIMEIKHSSNAANITKILSNSNINVISDNDKIKCELPILEGNVTNVNSRCENPVDSVLKSKKHASDKIILGKKVSDDCENKVVTYIKPVKPIKMKKILCTICNERLKSSRDLAVHNKIHQGEKYFKCDICSFVSLYMSSLRKHKRLHSLRKHTCSLCSASFTNEDRLNIHLKSHDSNKKYACNQCEFVSSYVSALNRHKLTHNLDKIFSCDECDEKFSQKFNLNTHKRLHSGKKVFKCEECSFITPYHYSLKRHKITHSGVKPFPCKYCDAAFAGAEDLKRHVRAHYGEKPFFCNICGRLFSQAAHIKNHKKIHFMNPEMRKIKKCLECGETFANLSLLRQHKKSFHQKKS